MCLMETISLFVGVLVVVVTTIVAFVLSWLA